MTGNNLKKGIKMESRSIEQLEAENEELKTNLNTVWQLVRQFLPACPAKSRKFLNQAIEDGKKLRAEGTHKLEEYEKEVEKLKKEIKRLKDIHSDNGTGCFSV